MGESTGSADSSSFSSSSSSSGSRVLFELDPALDRTDQSVADVDGLVGTNTTASEPVSEEEALGEM